MSYAGSRRKVGKRKAREMLRGSHAEVAEPSEPFERLDIHTGRDGVTTLKRHDGGFQQPSCGFETKEEETAEGQNEEKQTELGHNGRACENPLKAVSFLVTAETGVHSLRIQFCGDWTTSPSEEVGDKVPQLLKARMFPCSFKERKDMYENFIRCSHMWGVLTTKKRMGQAHGIDHILVHRPPGNTVVYCPSCPEPGFNMDPKMGPLPSHLRHLNQQRETLDGNFHCTKSTKNSDPKDISLYRGAGFFPTNEDLKAHLARVPESRSKEKSNCNYLKAVNNQDKKKFKNMEITGIVNVQCSHVFVKASVDLQYGERYANVDLALATAIRQKLGERYDGEVVFDLELESGERHDGEVWFDGELDSVDRVTSYDAACQYSVNVVKRFEDFFPDLAPIVKRMRWAVPALHIQGHQEECMYRFATCYMTATGHFHGESAEYYWPELNQIGTQVCQMSGGHRQDVISINHNDWNFKKTAKCFVLLLADLRKADITFRKHQKNFLGLCATYAAASKANGGSARSGNRTLPTQNTRRAYTDIPKAQSAIYELMLADEAAIANKGVRRNKVAAFLNDGIRIQDEQLAQNPEINRASRRGPPEPTIGLRCREGAVGAAIRAHRRTGVNLDVLMFVHEEGQLREGAAYDALESVKLVVKSLVSMRDRKKKNDSGVYKNTLSQKQINDTEKRRDLHIARYMAARDALVKLGIAKGDDRDFPVLEVKDTSLKSRTYDDSWRFGGNGWTYLGPRRDISTTGNAATTSAGTVMLRRARVQPKQRVPATSSAPRAVNSKKTPRKDGWLWGFKAGKMSAEELRKWTMEGDRIQWFRAEAEMERWREQVEIILADWRTSIRSFVRSAEVWMELASTQDTADIGHIAYAKRQAHIYAQREKQGRTFIGDHPTLGPKYGCIADDNLNLVGFVTKNREEDQRLQDAVLEQCRALEVEEAAERHSREKGGEEAEEEEWETDNEGNEGEDEDEDEDEEARMRRG
ncbi:hypothetical protein B0H13DRAFT_1887753 [Mycena leptocephala]|nr:hypothetical protein B0H13DRAFT_1887753 [Mycena leptocephala]